MISEWKTIDSAPKDGTSILVHMEPAELVDQESCAVAWWRAYGWVREGDDYSIAVYPTHWMPLPEPPKGE